MLHLPEYARWPTASERIQEGANRVAETQQALDAQKSIAQQYKKMADDETAKADRVQERVHKLEAKLEEWEEIAWRQIKVSAAETEQAISQAETEPRALPPPDTTS